jgi:hypothetical protein
LVPEANKEKLEIELEKISKSVKAIDAENIVFAAKIEESKKILKSVSHWIILIFKFVTSL